MVFVLYLYLVYYVDFKKNKQIIENIVDYYKFN